MWLPDLLRALRSLPESDRALIASVCQEIANGQRLDVLRFDRHTTTLQALNDALELDDYTWRVAGCVGYFWTDVCEAKAQGWRDADMTRMRETGRCYGMALQRLNILRDTVGDLNLGRCYWPMTELASVGLTPEALAAAVHAADPRVLPQITPLMNAWMAQIRSGLSQGVAYGLAVRPWRLRWASALPALIGLKTLQIMAKQGPMALTQPVKVPRIWLRQLLFKILLGAGTRSCLHRVALELGAEPEAMTWGTQSGRIGA